MRHGNSYRWGTFAFAVFTAAALPTISALGAGPSPTVTGPITGGAHDRPFTAAIADLGKAGYIEQEYFVEGSATAFGPAAGATLDTNGKWSVTPTGGQPYKTRILVRRPADPKRFNGTVVVEWLMAPSGFDIDVNWMWSQSELLRDGFVWVGVSAQRAGVDGTTFEAAGAPGKSMNLTQWDSARYGGLHIPSEDLAYDIYSQAGRLVGPARPKDPIDPLGGLKVQKLLAIGETFAGDHLVTYYDAIQPLAKVFDGFYIGWRHISGSAALAAGVTQPDVVKIRTDVHTPVIVVNSEGELLYHYPARQPDSDYYRLWEIAGGSHTNAYWNGFMNAEQQRDFGVPTPPQCDHAMNTLPNQYVLNAVIWQLNRWMKGGEAAPHFPPVTVSGSPPAIEHDEFGNTLGGVRLPEITVPIAQYKTGGMGPRKPSSPPPARTAGNVGCSGASGSTNPLPAQQLATLYPTEAAYLAKFTAATKDAERAGFLLPADGREAIAAARQAQISAAR